MSTCCIGHRIRAECEVIVAPDITAVQAHHVAVDAEHALLHAIPRLSAAHTIAVDATNHTVYAFLPGSGGAAAYADR
jgi:divalent metal cation (Fe/Co/Zn/Cd) transporter